MSNLLGLQETEPALAEEQDNEQLVAQLKGGANWFYWIAGLSMVNSLIYMFGGTVAFIAGLGFTQLADAFVDVFIENGAPSAFKGVAIVFNLVLVVVFALFGYYANKRVSTAFILGIALYTIDAVVLLLLGEMLSAGFHAFALFFIVRGFLASRALGASKLVGVA